MLDLTKPVQTRDGRKVRILCTDGPEKFPIAGYIDGSAEPDCWRRTGAWGHDADRHYQNDLVNVPTPGVVWVNVYRDGGSTSWNTRLKADAATSADRIARVRVEYTDGQFDE